MVMDKIKRLALTGPTPHKLNHAVFMLIAPPLVIVGLGAGIARGKQLSAHARARGRRNSW